MTADWILWIFAVLLGAAAVQDILTLRISNLFPLVLILLFGIWIAVVGIPDNWWENLLHFSIALIVGMMLFALGWFGGGDAKLYAGCALWFDLTGAIPLLLFVSLAGVILLLLMLARRRIRIARRPVNPPDAEARTEAPMQLPYGVAIAIGAIAALYFIGVNPPARPAFDPMAVPMPVDLKGMDE